jgi:hypothetical protein
MTWQLVLVIQKMDIKESNKNGIKEKPDGTFVLKMNRVRLVRTMQNNDNGHRLSLNFMMLIG